MSDRPNADEGADPSEDIRKQNPGETTTADLVEKSHAEKSQGDPSRANEPEQVEDRPNVGQVAPEDIPNATVRRRCRDPVQAFLVNEVLRPPSSLPGV